MIYRPQSRIVPVVSDDNAPTSGPPAFYKRPSGRPDPVGPVLSRAKRRAADELPDRPSVAARAADSLEGAILGRVEAFRWALAPMPVGGNRPKCACGVVAVEARQQLRIVETSDLDPAIWCRWEPLGPPVVLCLACRDAADQVTP